MISVSSIDCRIALFIFIFLLQLISSLVMAKPANVPSTTNDEPSTNTGKRASTCTNPRTPRHHQSFKGQNYDLWKVAITTDNLKPAHFNKIKLQTLTATSDLCTGNIAHVLKAIEAGKDTVFKKPTLNSATPTEAEKIEFKIDCEEYFEDMHTYENNKSKLTLSLLGQCVQSVTEQLKEMKDHSTG